MPRLEFDLTVRPDHAGRGIGSALMQTFLEGLSGSDLGDQLGPVLLITRVDERDERKLRFLSHWGFTEVMRGYDQYLNVSEVDLGRFGDLEGELRCVETGQILKPLVFLDSRRRVKRIDPLAYGGDPTLAWREIAAFEGIVAAVGHSPDLEMLLGVILGISPEGFSLAKGEAFHLANRAGQMIVVESLRPEQTKILRRSANEI